MLYDVIFHNNIFFMIYYYISVIYNLKFYFLLPYYTSYSYYNGIHIAIIWGTTITLLSPHFLLRKMDLFCFLLFLLIVGFFVVVAVAFGSLLVNQFHQLSKNILFFTTLQSWHVLHMEKIV